MPILRVLRSCVANLGAIGEFVRCEVDFAKGAFANESSYAVIADCDKVLGGEFATTGVNTPMLTETRSGCAYSRSSLYELAS